MRRLIQDSSQGLLLAVLMMSCATPRDPGEDFILIRPFQSKSLLRLEASLQDKALARDLAQGLPPTEITRLEPNAAYKNGLSLGYGAYSVSFSRPVPARASELDQSGRTQASDYQFHGAWKALGFDIYSQEYKGFHDRGRENTEAGGTRYLYYPDLTLSRRGFNLFYINDAKNYKHNAQLHQSEYQAGSGDSLLLLTSMDYLQASHIPEDLQQRYQESIAGDRLDALSVSFLLGYAFILKSPEGPWLAANILGGRSYQLHAPIEELGQSQQTFKPADKVIASASLGLDRALWFFGLKFWADSLLIPLERSAYALNTSSFELFLGCRI
jgi:hypothetical protein